MPLLFCCFSSVYHRIDFSSILRYNKLNYYPLRRADPICQRLSLRESWQSRRL
ncbi:hypothetical protein FAEPRAA2165_03161 [Faecalibacterium duncaniae]|uniref:Uncharacterized protein n=1 Tax=Faecalibacterium duncaniae (strain DSM 17677 / JCM 31915 / A2-165) TaxID=411483 RepID=C7HA06_FAED2|nr:hypothetical protein FAEPRAA2165_03161 [Faecalibacterium duncaniae]